MKIHDVFHVSLLKRYLRDRTGRIDPPPPPEVIDDELEWEVETILGHCLVKRGRKNKVEYLIKSQAETPPVTPCDCSCANPHSVLAWYGTGTSMLQST